MCPIACRQAPTWGSAVGVFAFDLCGSLPADDSAVVQAQSLAGKLSHGAVRLACFVFDLCGSLPADDSAVIQAPSLADKPLQVFESLELF